MADQPPRKTLKEYMTTEHAPFLEPLDAMDRRLALLEAANATLMQGALGSTTLLTEVMDVQTSLNSAASGNISAIMVVVSLIIQHDPGLRSAIVEAVRLVLANPVPELPLSEEARKALRDMRDGWLRPPSAELTAALHRPPVRP